MRNRWFGPAIILAMWAFALAVYPSLPEQVPTQWSAGGEVTEWGDRWPWAIAPSGIALGAWLLAWVLPRIDPRREHYPRFRDTYWLLTNLVIAFIAATQVLVVGESLRWPLRLGSTITVLTGILLVGIGNQLPRLRSNWWMGIRTPWTLDSERVWRDTHRVGGRVFVLAGLLVLASALLPSAARSRVMDASIAGAALVSIVYSFVVWRREQAAG